MICRNLDLRTFKGKLWAKYAVVGKLYVFSALQILISGSVSKEIVVNIENCVNCEKLRLVIKPTKLLSMSR